MLLAFTLLSAMASALASNQCSVPSWVKECPGSGAAGILDDTYPTQAFVVSYKPYIPGTTAGAQMPARTISEVMRSYNYQPQTMPMIVFPASAAEYEAMRSELVRSLVGEGKSEASAQSLIESRVKHVEAQSWTWQQDYFESSFDPGTGQARIHHSEVYKFRGEQFDSITAFSTLADSGACGMQRGSELKSSFAKHYLGKTMDELRGQMSTEPTEAAELGGNMEGLPGGLCLVGDNMDVKFAEQICGNKENIVQIEVNWLQVGHVDEIMKVLPNRRAAPGTPSECAFTIASADTDLGFSLLESASSLNQQTLSLNVDSSDPTLLDSLGYTPFGEIACKAVQGLPESPNGDSNASGVRQVLLRAILPLAYAGEVISSSVSCFSRYSEINNRQFVDAAKSVPGLVDYNSAAQRSLMRSRQKIYDSILGRLPQCRPYFRTLADMFTPVPNLFSPQAPGEAKTRLFNNELAHGSAGFSLFPNPTNSVIANNSVIFPAPVPNAYSEHYNRVIRGLGLTPRYVDTWDYAHTGQGNLHCSTHSIPYCTPRSQN